MSKINFFLSKNKEKIRYKLIQGKKPVTIIFLHGFMSDLTGKKIQVLSKLSKKEQVSFLGLEYTGHGKSSGQLSDYGIDDWINQSKELVEKVVKTKSPIKWSDFINSGFVGIASAPDFTKEIMWKNFSKKTKSMIKSGRTYYMPSSYGNPYPISKKLIFDRSKHLVLNKKIKCNFPVRLFHGLKDTVVDVNFSIRLTKTLLSNDSIITFQNNGDHSLSQTEDLKKIKNQLTNLIKDSC